MRTLTQNRVRADDEIKADIVSELQWDPYVLDATIDVTVDSGTVTLQGVANSLANRDAINEAAHRVQGVRDVVDNMKVQPDATTVRTDDDLEHVVRDVLHWQACQPMLRVFGKVKHGVVTLHGEVDTWTQRSDAESVIRGLAGVRAVDNLVSVRVSPVTSEAMQSQIERAIQRHAGRDSQRVHVNVVDSVASLSGRVNSWAERKSIERIAGSMEGIQDVQNGLNIDMLH